MASTQIFIPNTVILSMDDAVGDFECGDILIEDSEITAVGTNLEIPTGATIIDGSNRIVIPGFVDCHRHSWEGSLRLIHPDSKTLPEYMEVALRGFRSVFRPEDVYTGTLSTAISCLDAGITSVLDNMHCFLTQDHGKAALDAWHDSGVPAIVAVEQTPWGQPPTRTEEDIKAVLRELQEHINGKKDPALEMAIFGQNIDEEHAAARQLGIRVVLEVFADISQGWLKSANEKGFLSSSVTVNHVTAMPASDWEIIRESDVRVNICPRSDAQWALADGICAYQYALGRGIHPGLSIDNEIAYGGDMFSEMKILFTLQRALAASKRHSGDVDSPNPITVREILKAATIDGARALGWEGKVGSLTPGKDANMLLLRSDDLNVYPAHNAAGTVVLASDRSNIDTVIVRGVIRKRAGQLVDFDLKEYRSKIDKSVSYLFSKKQFVMEKTSIGFKGWSH